MARAVTFTRAEQAVLKAASIAVFNDRIILKAQPPITAKQLASVAAQCKNPLPDELVALWRTAFGGELAYDLRVVPIGEKVEIAVNLAELFYPGSSHYRDLDAWIDHEKDLRDDYEKPLAMLPIGGAEYYERVYVCTKKGKGCGAVWFWQRGLPGATLSSDADSSAQIAPSLSALFDELALEVDPATSDEARGRSMLDAIDVVAKRGAAGKSAATKLRALVNASILDWRGALAKRSIAKSPRLRRLALEYAATTDDVALLDQLAAAGCDLKELLAGGNGLVHALTNEKLAAARRFLAAGADATRALRPAAGVADLELVRELLACGGIVDVATLSYAFRRGAVEVALFLQKAAPKLRDKYLAEAVRERAKELRKARKTALAKQLDAIAKRVEPSSK